ncbi:phage/plasmid primase, P4 family [Mycolicibacterium frederiksbergense]|uniref:phage/plasmid primase, P4 family n=1 Tax=Mycolicibacterium frederiksbergense TaxID=117567 RepID=UPI00265C0D58|nr:phage/plasmid primase, P4 family [Mycolicibacterium frederiksbergense]MDO0974024.1 phage/plasmid primase, P4 family [Mycolicibacterium frederiksbergense]
MNDDGRPPKEPATANNTPSATTPATGAEARLDSTGGASGYADAEQVYWESGWRGILPLKRATKWPPPQGFTGHDGAIPSYADVSQWAELYPDGNVAVRLPDGVIGIDVDAYGAKTGGETLAEAERRWGPLPDGPRSSSRPDDPVSGIRLFRVPAGTRLVTMLGFPELSIGDVEIIQRHHRYAVCWPSIHPDTGQTYQWYGPDGTVTDPPTVDGLPDLPPEWLAGLADDDPVGANLTEERADIGACLTEGEPSSRVTKKLNAALVACAGSSRHDNTLRNVMALLRFGRQNEPGVKTAVQALGQVFIAAVTPERGAAEAASEYRRMVYSERVASELAYDDTDWMRRLTERAAANGNGMSPPVGRLKQVADEPPGAEAPGADDEDRVEAHKFPDKYRPTDVGNAGRLLAHARGRIRYVHAWGKWIVYQNGRWIIDEKDALVSEIAKIVPRRLYELAAETAMKDTDKAKPIWNWALKSDTSNNIAAMIRLARGMQGVIVDHDKLDADPWLLNCRNGTIDLRTGELLDHDPADLCTLQAPVRFDPEAAAPLWESCLQRWQPGDDVRDYLQVRAGAGASGMPTETVDIDYGGGGNGKSKFHGAVQHVLGPYACVPHKSLLVAGRFEQHPTVIADLFRKRLAVASETKQAENLDDESVKNLTGGDRLKGRRMKEDPWEFWPTHTLIMLSNHLPTVQGRDEGIWRRLRLVPWTVTIGEDERDERLAAKLREEAPGILNWIVAGAVRFYRDGLNPPDSVRAATDGYRAEEDVIGRFITECLSIDTTAWCHSTDIQAELDSWCAEQSIAAVPRMNEVAATLRERGCKSGGRKQVGGKRSTIWRGVSVTQAGDETV